MAIKFSQFNLRTDSTPTMFLVGYDGNQNIHITVDNLFNDFINGTENTIAMFGPGGTSVIDSTITQQTIIGGDKLVTVQGFLNIDKDVSVDRDLTVTRNSILNGNVTLGDASTDLITQTGTLYLNGPIKDTTNTLGIDEQILVSDAIGELTFRNLYDTTVGKSEAVVQTIKCNEAIPKGCPVYIVGFQPGENANIVAKADASNPAKMPATGVADEDYAAQDFGTMTAFGSFNGDFDTTGGTENWAIGQILYVKPGGGLTNIKPTGTNLIQNIAIVSRVQSQTGEMEVIALGRTNDIPNLTQGKIWVGSTGNTIESNSITFTEATGAVQLNQYGTGTITGTAARNLSVDISGNIIETDAAIDGSGTLNYVAKFTPDGNTLGNSVIYNDGTNVGIGETNPDTILHITGNEPTIKLEDNVGADFYNPKIEFFGSSEGGTLEYISNPNFSGMRLHNKSFFPTADTFLNLKYGLGEFQSVGITGGTTLKTDGVLQVTGSNDSYFSNGNVGIGTTTPQQALDVRGAISVGNSFQGDIYFSSVSNGPKITGVQPGLGGQLIISTSGSEKMRVTSGGNVGIGTIGPAEKLDVAGNIKMNETAATTDTDKFIVSDSGVLKYRTGAEIRSDIDAIGGSGTAGTIPVFTSGGTSLTDSIITQTSLPNRITIGGELSLQGSGDILNISHYQGTTWFIDTSTGDDILFGAPAANTQNVGVQGDLYAYDGDLGTKNAGSFNNLISRTGDSYFNVGDVGIGTTNPLAKLDVNGNFRINTNNLTLSATPTWGVPTQNIIGADDNTNGATLTLMNTSATIPAGGVSGTLQFVALDDGRNSGGSGYAIATISALSTSAPGTGNGGGGNLIFKTAASYSNIAERMRINSSGKVGIGTTDPQGLLHISSDSTPTLIVGTKTANQANSGAISFREIESTSEVELRYNGADNAFKIWTSLAGDALTVLRSNGNVSIGTDTTSSKLEVRQDANNGNTGAFTNTHVKLTASATADNTGFVGITAATSTADNYGYSFGAQRTSGGVGDFKINYHNNSAAGTNRFIIDQDGNVGINDTDPDAKLTVFRTDATYVVNLSDTESRAGLSVKSSSSFDSKLTISSGASSRQYIQAVNNAATTGRDIVINPYGGNVGIGTTSPAQKLDVAGSVRVQDRLYTNANATNSVGILGKATVNGWASRYDSNNANFSGFYFDGNHHSIIAGRNAAGTITNWIHASGSSYFNGGNVGIGNTNPSYLLDVNEDDNAVAFRVTGGGGGAAMASFVRDVGSTGASVNINAQSNFPQIQFVSTGNTFSIGADSSGNFKISDNTSIGTNDRITIDVNGNVKIGPNTQSGSNQAAASFITENDVTIGGAINWWSEIQNGSFGTYNHAVFYHGTTQAGSIRRTGNSTVSYNTSSDYRLKENIIEIADGIERVKQLKPSKFNFIGEERIVDGFLAHEVQNVVPESISGEKDEVDAEGNPVYQAIDQSKIVPLLAAALKEAIEKIEQLETRIQTLENK